MTRVARIVIRVAQLVVVCIDQYACRPSVGVTACGPTVTDRQTDKKLQRTPLHLAQYLFKMACSSPHRSRDQVPHDLLNPRRSEMAERTSLRAQRVYIERSSSTFYAQTSTDAWLSSADQPINEIAAYVLLSCRGGLPCSPRPTSSSSVQRQHEQSIDR
jgi:hypothetical protein